MADVKLLASQRLTDNPDGGGLATADEVVDGAVNNLFDDVSRIDRVNGDVSLRKVFPQATTADTELFSGLHLVVVDPPDDPRVSTVAFSTDSWADERADAQAFVERYLDESVITRLVPYDRQLAGQRTVLAFQRAELPLPEIGEVYVLKNEAAGQTEFVRVSDIDHQVETFTDSQGDFNARVITLTISQPLTQEFSGSQPNRFFVVEDDKSEIRASIVSDAARYKGVAPLAADASVGAVTIRVGTVFGQLVPSAASETGITDAEPAGASVIAAAAEEAASVSVVFEVTRFDTPIDEDFQIMPMAITPGTVRMTLSGGPFTSGTVIVDDGIGGYEVESGAATLGLGGITFNYETGRIDVVNNAGTSGGTGSTGTCEFIPAAHIERSGLSYQLPVSMSTRGYVYISTLRPIPVPGTLVVSFRALGKWYELRDDGTGALVGDVGVGSGLLNFTSGTVSVTLGALPDIGSSVIFAWGGDSDLEIRTTDLDILPPRVDFTLASGNCEPSSLAVSWFAGGVAKAATDDGAGSITGDATGRIVYGTGKLSLRPALLPDADTTFEIEYQAGVVQTELFNPVKSGNTITMTVANGPIRPRSLLISYQMQQVSGPLTATTTQQLTDNGAGELLDAAGQIKAGAVVNYTTGQISFNPDFTAVTPVLGYEQFENQIPARTEDPDSGYFSSIARFGKWPFATDSTSTDVGFADGTNVTIQYKQDAAVDAAQTESLPVPTLQIDLTPGVTSAIVPGGLMFTFGGRTYIDRQGTLFYGIDRKTLAGTTGGSVDYTSGVATIDAWVDGASSTLSINALLAEVRPLPLATVHGRTPGSPLRPGSFSVTASRYRDSALISAVADNNGNIDTPEMHGYIDVTTGVFSIAFGGYVLDSSLTADEKAEGWYSVDAVDADGYIWKPDEIIPGSLSFNCVVQVSLPLDPEIIGINPVRLPLDGRVQIIREGDTLVIHDTLTEALPDALVADQVVPLSRGDLASVVLYDQNAVAVDPLLYSADLVAGEVTMANPLDLSAYVQPLLATHRIEDMALCTDAQITGDIGLAQALTHGYTAANSMVSSALVIGDVQARYESLFAQNTWTSEWSDDLIGDAPTSGAQYNDVTYPVAVLNRDAITQRWRIQFTSSTAFNIVAEELGVIGTGTTSTGAAPINPETGQPYFTMAAAGFGSGWATGNLIRFNTVAAGAPVWLARVVRSGPASEQDDQTKLLVRWDKD